MQTIKSSGLPYFGIKLGILAVYAIVPPRSLVKYFTNLAAIAVNENVEKKCQEHDLTL